MRGALVVLLLAAVAATGCGMGVGNLLGGVLGGGDLQGLLDLNCQAYDGNGDGTVTRDEVTEATGGGLELVGATEDDILDALEQIGCDVTR